jgi:hypothetical protein
MSQPFLTIGVCGGKVWTLRYKVHKFAARINQANELGTQAPGPRLMMVTTMYDSEDDDFGDDGFEDDNFDAGDFDDDVELVDCPECGEEVYEEAEQCPYCGNFIVRSQIGGSSAWSGRPLWWLILGLVGIGATIVALVGY